ncbi:hypothetical protein F5148DRAFT_989926, partial [Russula earlei]
ERPPEAQYQDEFYRRMFVVTSGNVRVSPEFTIAGCIDFLIPLADWGIKITRDGSLLKQHASHFEEKRAYRQWLKAGYMKDYILLDFRTTSVRDGHPGTIFHLTDWRSMSANCFDQISLSYIIVFQDNYQQPYSTIC